MPDDNTTPIFHIVWSDIGPMCTSGGYYAVRQDSKLILGPYANQLDAGKAARDWIMGLQNEH